MILQNISILFKNVKHSLEKYDITHVQTLDIWIKLETRIFNMLHNTLNQGNKTGTQPDLDNSQVKVNCKSQKRKL